MSNPNKLIYTKSMFQETRKMLLYVSKGLKKIKKI